MLDIELDLGKGRALQLFGGEPWQCFIGTAFMDRGILAFGFGPWRAVLTWPDPQQATAQQSTAFQGWPHPFS